MFSALYSLPLMAFFYVQWPGALAGTGASTSPTPPCMLLRAGTGIKDKQCVGKLELGFFFLLVSISCLLLAHLLTGRKRSLLRLGGVGLKM